MVGEIDKAILSSNPKKYYIGESKSTAENFEGTAVNYKTFDVPGDGKFNVRNTKEDLTHFKKKVLASAGFKESKSNKKPPYKNRSANAIVEDFLNDGEYENAYYAAKEAGVVIKFGSGNNKDGAYANPYTSTTPIDLIEHRKTFVGKRKEQGTHGKMVDVWNVIDEKIGLSIADAKTRKEALLKAKLIDKDKIIQAIERQENDNNGKNQSELLALFKKEHGIVDDNLKSDTPLDNVSSDKNRSKTSHVSGVDKPVKEPKAQAKTPLEEKDNKPKQNLDKGTALYSQSKKENTYTTTGNHTDDFVLINGSKDWGEVNAKIAGIIKRQKGKIRLLNGQHDDISKKGYGLKHINEGHLSQIKKIGFNRAEDFISYILNNAAEVWQGHQGQLLIISKVGRNTSMFIQLQSDKQGGLDYYRVNTAFPIRNDNYAEKKKFTSLLTGSEPLFKTTGKPHSFATFPEHTARQVSPNATESDKLSIAQVKSLLPRRVDKQLNTGQLKIFQRASDLPSHLKDLSHVEGFYDPHTNKVYLVADRLNKGNINAVLQHELFHRARATDKKLQSQLDKLDKRLQARFNLAAKGLGTPIEKEAYQRVISAKTDEKDQLEEFQAYLITQYESNPQSLSASLRKWVKDLIATIRAALIRQGLLPKHITPADLSALAKYGAKQGKVGKGGKDTIALASQQGYQGNDKGEAEEWLRAKAKGLDMSHKARMKRAKDMGFDVDTVYYHANTGGIRGNGFDNSMLPDYDPDAPFNAHWFGIEPSEFSAYPKTGNTITPVLINTSNPVDFKKVKDISRDIRGSNEVREKLDKLGYTHSVWRGRDSISIDKFNEDGELSFRTSRNRLKKIKLDTEYGGIDLYDGNEFVTGYEDIRDFIKQNPEIEDIAVFNPKNIRSINAAFDPDYADSSNLLASKSIKYSRTSDAVDSIQSNAQKLNHWLNGAPLNQSTGGNLGLNDEAVIDKLIRLWQDGFNRVNTLQKTIKARGGVVNENNNVYLAEERSSGITSARLDDLRDHRVTPLVDAMKAKNITLEQLDNFVRAKHAGERNDYIASINPEQQDSGSGLSYQQAQTILSDFEQQGVTAQLESLADQVYAMNDQALNVMVADGLIDSNTYQQYQGQYQYYVPLKGKEGMDNRAGNGQGYSVSGAGIKKALGRGEDNLSESPVAHSIAQAESAIIRAEKARVGRTLVQLIKDNPDPSFWTVTQSNYNQFIGLEGELFEGFDTLPEGLIENQDIHSVMGISAEEKKQAKAEGRKPKSQGVQPILRAC